MLRTVKNIIFRCFRGWFRLFGTDGTQALPQGPVLVIAPHPDDETIGCGAAIARFRAEGREVRVIIITDGGASTQSAVITSVQLSELRLKEALKAAMILGLSEENIVFLSYPDGGIARNGQTIADTISTHIAQFRPAVIFAPHPLDEHEDHRAAAIIIGQLKDEGKTEAVIFQYPIWYNTLSWPYGVLRCLLSPPMYKQCRYLPAGGFMATKKEALREHRSQFENITGEDSWQFFSPASFRRFCESPELYFERVS